jgi:SSS family solute:Na+ symporter
MGLPSWLTPYACGIMGLITVIYTSVGGLRAVVATDVIQSFILLGGAILTIVLITFSLGGIGNWWPATWPEHWDTFQVGLDPTARFTVVTACLSQLVWWVCTSGSDQMAIQRYMATKDVHSARRVLGTSLFASGLSIMLLAIVGLAVLGYFQTFPDRVGHGSIADNSAAALFPHFIVIGFPQGITGLVIAGILAAAMSSLSSGFNSGSLVVSVDFFDRLGWGARDEAHRIRRTKNISWCVGLLTVVSSMMVGFIEGDLLTINYKTSNLLVTTLFLPFFMAFFVRWSTTFGTWVGTLAAMISAIAIAFFEVFGLTIAWIMPASLVVGIVFGCVFSLFPLGRRPVAQ